MAAIKIHQKSYPLYWDLYAEKRISEKMGKERVFADWLREEKNRFKHISFVLVELINGGIRKKNAMLAAGFSSGEKETLFQMTDEEQESFLSLFRVVDCSLPSKTQKSDTQNTKNRSDLSDLRKPERFFLCNIIF